MALADVHGAAAALLQLVVDTAAEEGVELPARRYVTAGAGGNEAWDCDQVTAGMVSLSSQQPSRSGAHVGPAPAAPGMVMFPTATLQVEIVRPHPVMEDGDDAPPSAAVEHAAGVVSLRDAALLHAVRTRAKRDAALTGGSPGQIALGDITPVGPEGGLSAMRLVVSVALT